MTGAAGIIKPGLDRISRLLKYLGNPQKKLLSIQIAGTNGKGSTAAYIHNILLLSGIKTGIYTSPHILSPRERIRVANQLYEGNVNDDVRSLERDFLKSSPHAMHDRPTFFELVTALALDYFREKKVSLAILEVGLGGRLDATSAAGSIGKILTDVSLDHTEFLGNSIEEILLEKVVPLQGDFLITCSLPQFLFSLAARRCEKKKGRVQVMGRDFFYEKMEDETFIFYLKNGYGIKLRKCAAGDFQYRNATIAVAGALMMGRYLRTDQRVLHRSVKRGVEETRVTGRFQQVLKDPTVILDVGHNHLSSSVLQKEIAKLRDLRIGRTACIFTMMRNRNPRPFVTTLAESVERFIYFPAGDITWKRREIKEIEWGNGIYVAAERDFPSAFKSALDYTGREGIVLLTGSYATAEHYLKMMGYHGAQVLER